MLAELPFFPRLLSASDRLLLIPYCHHRAYWSEYEGQARRRQSLLGARVLDFERFSVLTGFMGYPHLLTVLAGIAGWREKRLYFLGTAGCLDDSPLPDLVTVSSVRITPELAGAFPGLAMDMTPLPAYPARSVVTVDIAQRETTDWAQAARSRLEQRVEMELAPLRFLYGRPFTSLLVGSDRVGAQTGCVAYTDLVEKFTEAFRSLLECIDEE